MDPNTQLKLWRAMKPVRDRIIEELYERSQDFLDDLLKFVDGDEGARAYLKGEVGTRLAIASIYFEKISNELHAAYKQCEECLHIQDPTQEQLNKKIFKMKYHLREMLMERALVPHWVN